jgi:undecaprenyl-diphosphatase
MYLAQTRNDGKMVRVLDLDRRLFLAVYAGPEHARAIALVMVALTVLGSGWTIFALVPLFALARARRFVSALVGTLALTGLVVFLLKLVIGRPRPPATIHGVQALFFDVPTDFSFPSGHAAGSFAFAAFVGTVILSRAGPAPRPRHETLGVFGLFALASGIALSRVYLGCHYPGDVVGGAVLGAIMGGLGARMYAARGAAVRAPAS